jgi:hypothetical protein
MNINDLLYTNQFVNTESLSKNDIQKNANEYIPYRTLKSHTVNNVRDELERTGFTNNPIIRAEKEANPWNKGYFGNQRPMLSEFGQDIAESSYFKYRTKYINIDSRMRDISLYPSPNNYNIFLGSKYDNIEAIKLIDYFFPEMEYPINTTNNIIMWFTIPFEMVQYPYPYTPNIGNGSINICGWNCNFYSLSRLIDPTCQEEILNFRNNVYSCLNKIEINPGFYTTDELSIKIETEFRKTTFFNGNIFNSSFLTSLPDSETLVYKNRSQLATVRIDPNTSEVSFLLRYEELRINKITTYYNQNFFDLELKVIDNSISSVEFLELMNNTIYPLVITGFPEIGGYNTINVDYYEFIPKSVLEVYQAQLPLFFKTYYDIIKDPNTGEVIPNALRFYLYTVDGKPIKSSYSEELKVNNIKLGREAPFFLVNGADSPLFEFIRSINNNIYNYNNSACPICKNDSQPICTMIPQTDQDLLNSLITNIDCSSRILTNILGYLDASNSKILIGPDVYAFGIIPNNIYKANKFINSIQSYNINNNTIINFIECQNKYNNDYIANIQYNSTEYLNYRLPISRNQNGTYSFYITNYFFMKLLSPVLNKEHSDLIQIKPTSSFANGSSDIYETSLESVLGVTYSILPANNIQNPSNCKNSDQTLSNPITTSLTKNLENLFAKIKYSSISGSYDVDNRFVNEALFNSESINNLDSFVVQLVDYEGKILSQTKDHNFTLMIVEKHEVLKETNINSRTGSVNIGGLKPVERNSFSNS